MLSTEIAELTGKNHKDVMRDIRSILFRFDMEKDGADLRSGFKSSTYLAGNGKQEKCHELDYEATMILMTGYDVVTRAKAIKYWRVRFEEPVIEPVENTPVFEIEIYIKNIGNDEVNAVNARELWAKLESGQQFSDWIKNRIEKYEFIEGTDFIVQKIMNGESRGFQPINYYISLDMARELSMVENNAQGKIARRYFIECEKQAKSAPVDHLSISAFIGFQQPQPRHPRFGLLHQCHQQG